jgi:hypothetical protein
VEARLVKFGVALAFVAGFISLSCEILWYRAYSVGSEVSPSAFGLMLGFYLVGIAAGAFGAGKWCAREAAPGARHVAGLGGFVLVATALSYLVVPVLAAALGRGAPWRSTLPLVALAAGAMGAVLPVAAHLAVPPDDRAGARVSWIWAGNIAGSVLGTLLTGYVLLETLPMRHLAPGLAAAGVALAAALFARAGRLRAAAAAILAGAALLPAANGVLFDALWERLVYRKDWRESSRFELVLENRHDVLCVTPEGVIFGGGTYDGALNVGFRPDRNNIWRAYAIAALHPAPKRVLMIGMSGGAWSQVLANAPGVEKVTVVEINPACLEVAARSPEIAGVLRNPKVEIVIDDGRRWLARNHGERFDVIVQNTSQHRRAHATNLLSREHIETLRSRLRRGGIACWNTTDSPEAMRAGLDVFPHAGMLWNVFIGSESPVAIDEARWERVLREYSIEGRPVFGNFRTVRSHAGWTEFREAFDKGRRLVPRADIEACARGAVAVTDDNMASEWAGRSER